MIETLSVGVSAVSLGLAAFAVWTMSRTVNRVLTMLSAERTEAREEAAALANRLAYPQVYQPTPAQRAEGKELRDRAVDPDPWAEEFESAGTVDDSIPDPDQMMLVGEGPEEDH